MNNIIEWPQARLRMEAKDFGVALRHGAGNSEYDASGARDVWVFESDGTYYMHYDGAGPEGWQCALAVSEDMIHWEKKGLVLQLGEPGEDDSKASVYGTTYFDGKEWHMFYIGSPNTSPPPLRIPSFPYLTMKARSNSPAGPWIKQKDVVPFRPKKGTYYEATASSGHIVKYGDEYLQFFSASIEDDVVMRTIGIARTKDLNGEWSVDPTPILPLEEQIENSSLYYEKENDTWFLFTNHVGIDPDASPEDIWSYWYTDAIWVYWTKDLNHWNTENKAVVLDKQNCTWSKVIGLPSVVQAGNRLAIFYDGVQGSDVSHVNRDIGLAWLDLPLEPPMWK